MFRFVHNGNYSNYFGVFKCDELILYYVVL